MFQNKSDDPDSVYIKQVVKMVQNRKDGKRLMIL